MREEYDIKALNPRKNPYAARLKKQREEQSLIGINNDTVDYFKVQAEEIGMPYQTLINLYLADCVKHGRKLDTVLK